jgi:hypothetical protein
MQSFSLADAVLMTDLFLTCPYKKGQFSSIPSFSSKRDGHQLQVLVMLKPRNLECLLLLDAAPIGELGNLQRFCPLNEVWQVKVDNIVSDDDVRI